MSDESPPPQSPPRTGRRSSFAGQTFADLFSSGRPSLARGSTDAPPPNNSPPPAPQPVGPISKAAQQAQQRRLSLTTLGLSGSPNQSSPFAPFRSRGDSFGSTNSGSINDSAIAEDEAPREQGGDSSPTTTPFARRTSFGAKALRDIRSGSFSGQGGGGAPGSPGQNGTNAPSSSSNDNPTSKKNAKKGTISSRDAKGRVEGFNWSENLRSRAERTASIAGQGGLSPGGGVGAALGTNDHSRAKSIATMEQPPVAPPKPKEKPRPDHFQERILKGDFYMD